VQTILAVRCVVDKEEPFNCGTRINELMGNETLKVMFDSGENDVEDTHVQQLTDLLRKLHDRGFEWAGEVWQLAKLPCGTQAIALGSNKSKRRRAARLALALSVSVNSDGHRADDRNESDSDPFENILRRAKHMRLDMMEYLSIRPSSARSTKKTRFIEEL
jgi:hypothetical protein